GSPDGEGGAAIGGEGAAAGDGGVAGDRGGGAALGEDEGSGAELLDVARTAERIGEDDSVGALEGEVGVVGDRSGAERAGGATVADLEGAVGDGGGAGVAVVGEDGEGGGTVLGEGSAAADAAVALEGVAIGGGVDRDAGGQEEGGDRNRSGVGRDRIV